MKYWDESTGKTFNFLTNNFAIPALTVAELYRYRWQVELFFKWIKQHLRIKSFFGTSENAVKSQIWIAVSVYVLVAILKKRLDLPVRTLAETSWLSPCVGGSFSARWGAGSNAPGPTGPEYAPSGIAVYRVAIDEVDNFISITILSLYTILQTLSLTAFEKTPLLRLFSETDYTSHSDDARNLLNLLD